MEKIESIIENNIRPDSKVNAIAIIEGTDNLVYMTENWNIKNDLDLINDFWDESKKGRLKIAGTEYIILQCSAERLVGTSLTEKENILGFRDDERQILCRLEAEGKFYNASIAIYADIAKTLTVLRAGKPYMEPDKALGKKDELKWATPKVLPNDTLNLVNKGLLKFGMSEEEAEVYLTLLKKGDRGESIGNLNKELLNLKRTHIYRIFERLIKNNWVTKIVEPDQKVQKYRALSLNNVIDDTIRDKETELRILKSFRYILGDKLENGWINISDLEHVLQDFYKKEYDFNTLGITGVEKDCGLLVFEYESPVDNNIIVRAALQLSSEKLRAKLYVEEDIQVQEDLVENVDEIVSGYKNPDIEDIKIVERNILDYLGAELQVRFKYGSETAKSTGTDWIVAAKQVAVPVDDNIYVIWGSEEKFPILLNTILKIG